MGDEGTKGDKPPVEKTKYDQAFFLALAAKGKDAWNAWRHDPANEEEHVTFAGIDFSNHPNDKIDFSGFQFGDEADFSGCKWRGGGWEEGRVPVGFSPGRACFIGAIFGADIKFDGTNFGEFAIFEKADFFIQASFKSSTFGHWASFKGATFGNWARFEGAAFGDYVSFEDAGFAKSAQFDGAVFGDWASFKGATLWDVASFDGATFGLWTSFKGTTFGHSIWFDGAAFGDGANFEDTFFNGEVKFTGNSQWFADFQLITSEFGSNVRMALKKQHELSWRRKRSGPALFRAISFARARFDGEADFSGRSFDRTADFTNACFCYPPNFDAIAGAARIDFTGANVGFVSPGKRQWTEDTKIPVRLRALRKIAEETKNHDFERDLYITEREAERGIYLHEQREDLKNDGWKHWPRNVLRLALQGFWVFIMLLYRALSNYGRNPVLPFVWLVLSVPFFYWRYSVVLAPLMHQAGPVNADKYNNAIWMLAFGNTVPFVGPLTIDAEIKKFLFCPGFGSCLPIPPPGFQIWVVVQNLLSITLVFFIGLALRNYFKIK